MDILEANFLYYDNSATLQGNHNHYLKLALFALCLITFLVSFSAKAMNIAPEVGEWKHRLCQSSSYIPRIIRECEVWEEGEWAVISNYGACINKQNPFPWKGETQLIPKSIAYWGGTGASWQKHWLAKGEKLPSNGCWSGPPGYQNGIEVSNVGVISVQLPNGGTAATYPRRSREIECPLGYRLLSAGSCEPIGVNPHKNNDICPAGNNGSNPIHTALGTKLQQETDYKGTASGTLSFERFYTSANHWEQSSLGSHWRHTYDRKVILSPSTQITTATVYRSNGNRYYFNLLPSGDWQSDDDIKGVLTQSHNTAGVLTGWQYTENNVIETFNALGELIQIQYLGGKTETLQYTTNSQLQSVSDAYGKQLQFIYDGANRLIILLDPAGTQFVFDYDTKGNLISVSYPDSTPADLTDNPKRLYHYEDIRFPHALTGITHENNSRYATFQYAADGKATSSEHTGGLDKTTFVYNADNTTTVTDALGKSRTYQFATIQGVVKKTHVDSPCASCGGQQMAISYDAQGNIISRTDFNGNITRYQYDLNRNLEISRTEGLTSTGESTPATRIITTEWHPSVRLPVKITEPGRIQAWAYDDKGQVTEHTITDTATGATRSWQTDFTYSPDVPGAVLQKVDNGPRTDVADVTTYDYYAPDAACVGDHFGCRGQLKQVTDALGHVTRLSRYHANGQVEEINDAGSQLTKILEREYDQLGRLMLSIGGEGQNRRYNYDANGNPTAASDPRNTPEDPVQAKATDPLVLDNTVSASYDSLNRLTESVHPQQLADSNDDVISNYRYDALGHLIEVTDPNGSVTRYDVNAFGDLLQLDSPDTGITHYQYDAAGNRVAQTDARGVTVQYHYDAVNRLIAVDYPDDSLDETFGYDQNDQGQNGIGRLTSIYDGAGLTELSYDQYGNIVSSSVQIDNHQFITHYTHNSAGQLVQIRYPSGRTLDFGYNALGQIAQVTTILDGISQTLADQIDYLPFGPLSSLTYGNGLTETIEYDLAYRPVERNLEPIALHTQDYDPADNLIVLTDLLDSNRDKTFAYDGLSRLTAAQSGGKRQEYSFDANSNRLILSENGQAENYTYALDGNRLETGAGNTYQSDANGNVVDNSRFQFHYGDDNRLREVLENHVTVARYTYNAFSQRVKKVTAQGTIYYHYDLDGHLLAETAADGSTLREYAYLDDEPLALLAPTGYRLAEANGRHSVTLTEKTQQIVYDNGLGIVLSAPPTQWEKTGEAINYAMQGESLLTPNHYIQFSVDGSVATTAALEPGVQSGSLQDRISYHLEHWRNFQYTTLRPASRLGGYYSTYTSDENGVYVDLNNRTITNYWKVNDIWQWYHRTIPDSGFYEIVNGDTTMTVIRFQFADNGHVFSARITERDDGNGRKELVHGSLSFSYRYTETATLSGSQLDKFRQSNEYYYHTDHLGTPQLITDKDQNTVWQADYAPFGQAQVNIDTVANPLRFPGQYYDQETGLHYNWHRYYDPGTGRYLSSDPIGLDGGLNTYAYVAGNPINWLDPLGLDVFRLVGRGQHFVITGRLIEGDNIIGGPLDPASFGACGLEVGATLVAGELAIAKFLAKGGKFVPNSAGRFTNIGSGLSKADARALLRSGDSGLSEGQVASVLKKLGKGRVDSVGIKTVNQSGNVRLTMERAGAQSGFQRFSFEIDASGKTLRTVQTAFDDAGNLVRQAPGAAKNNLFDVK